MVLGSGRPCGAAQHYPRPAAWESTLLATLPHLNRVKSDLYGRRGERRCHEVPRVTVTVLGKKERVKKPLQKLE